MDELLGLICGFGYEIYHLPDPGATWAAVDRRRLGAAEWSNLLAVPAGRGQPDPSRMS